MLFGIVGISIVLLSNKFILKQKLTVFRNSNSKIIAEFVLAGVILSTFYLLKSIEAISYGIWFNEVSDITVVNELFSKIFDNTLYSILIIGPFSWFNEIFSALSVGYILINLFWHFSEKKIWVWCSILFTGTILAIVQINLGVRGNDKFLYCYCRFWLHFLQISKYSSIIICINYSSNH